MDWLKYQWVLGVGSLAVIFAVILWRNRLAIYDFRSGVDTFWWALLRAYRNYWRALIAIALAWAAVTLTVEIVTGSLSSEAARPGTQPAPP